MSMKSLMAGALVSVAAVAVSGAPNVSFAQSDVLSITGTGAFSGIGLLNRSVSLTQAQEALGQTGISLDFTAPISIPIPQPGGGTSDVLTLFPNATATSPVSIKLTSDNLPEIVPNFAESLAVAIPVTVESDSATLPAGLSDRLTVNGVSGTIAEPNGEPSNITVTFPGLTAGINEPPGTCATPPVISATCSDILAIPNLLLDLSSDGPNGVPDLPETLTGTITITAQSDVVPEPASLAILGVSLLGMGAAYRRLRK